MIRIEAMGASSAERPKPRQVVIKSVPSAQARNSSPALCPRKARPEHGLAKVTIMTTPAWQPGPLRLLRTGKPLLSSVVEARDPKGQQLDCCGGRRLMIIDGTSGKPQFLTVDMIMIIKHGHQFVAQVAMGAKRCRSHIKAAEVAIRITQTAGQVSKGQPAAADIQRRIQVSSHSIEVAVGEVIVWNFADEDSASSHWPTITSTQSL